MKTVQKNRVVLLPALLALVALIPLTACGSSDSSTGVGGQRNAPNAIAVLADSSLKKRVHHDSASSSRARTPGRP